jgi:hypothetical protein
MKQSLSGLRRMIRAVPATYREIGACSSAGRRWRCRCNAVRESVSLIAIVSENPLDNIHTDPYVAQVIACA